MSMINFEEVQNEYLEISRLNHCSFSPTLELNRLPYLTKTAKERKQTDFNAQHRNRTFQDFYITFCHDKSVKIEKKWRIRIRWSSLRHHPLYVGQQDLF